MPFAYVSGDPNNLVGGGPAAMTDIQGPFFDILAYLNSSAIADLAASLLYVGEVRWMAVAAPPSKWLRCDGTPVSRATYAALFNALGGAASPYGLGDGVNTFNVPDLTGRVPIGAGKSTGSTLTLRTAGQKFGNETEALSVAQIPSHSHTTATFPVTLGATGAGGGSLVVGSSTGSGTGNTGGAGSPTHPNLPPALVLPAYIYAGA